MRKNIVVGVGGTGSKIVESLVYLAFFGGFDMARELGNKVLGDSGTQRDEVPELIVRIVDPDVDNGILKRLNSLLECFRVGDQGIDLNGLFKVSKTSTSRTGFRRSAASISLMDRPDIEAASDATVRWANKRAGEDNIEKTFSRTDPGNIRSLFYDEFERHNVNLEQGCWGMPRIGTLALTHAFRNDYEDWNDPDKKEKCFWPKLVHGNNFNAGVKLMFAGSIFGGTGASVIKNLSRAYAQKHNDTRNCGIGMLFVLPYYKFDDGQVAQGGARSKNFPMNTKLALSYYSEKIFEGMEHVNPVLYLSGGDCNTIMKISSAGRETEAVTSIYGEDQSNPAMPTDLASALSMLHFYVTPTNDDGHANMVYMPDRGESTIPYPKICSTILTRLVLFCELWNEARSKQSKFDTGTLTGMPFTPLGLSAASVKANWSNYYHKIDQFVECARLWVDQLKLNGVSKFVDIREYDINDSMVAWRDDLDKWYKKNKSASDNDIYIAIAQTLMSLCERAKGV
jgi:hypothetical protein